MTEPRSRAPAGPILVTGGTGVLGRLVVAGLLADGRAVRILSRGRREHDVLPGVGYATADLASGDGVAAAVAGIETIVHLAGEQKGDDVKAKRLVEAAAPAGVRHVVYISVVGDDRVPMAGAVDRAMFGYFGSKHAAGEVIAGSGIPWTTLRATQFFDLTLARRAPSRSCRSCPCRRASGSSPWTPARSRRASWSSRPGPPPGHVPDLGGPRIYTMDELLRSYLLAAGKRRLIVRVPAPGKAARGDPGRGEPRPGPGGGPADLGGVPRRAGRAGFPARAGAGALTGRNPPIRLTRTFAYVNVHNARFPAGSMRCQLEPRG